MSLTVKNFTFRYDPRGGAVVHDVNFAVETGSVMGLVGPNGSGKTTLLKVIAGILSPSRDGFSGSVVLGDGTDLMQLDQARRVRRIAYVGAETRSEFPVTALEVVLLGRSCRPGDRWLKGASSRDEQDAQLALERAGCLHLKNRRLDQLSGGERQLVGVARALMQDAPILFLDEAFSKMDLHHQVRMGHLIRSLAQEGRSAVLVAHDLDLISEWTDTSLLLLKGSAVGQGPTEQLFRGGVLEKLYPGLLFQGGVNPISGRPRVFWGQR